MNGQGTQRSKACLDLKRNLAALTTEKLSISDNLKFSEISLGYAGQISGNLTLNGKFYCILLNSIQEIDFDKALIFPQRVPRIGFFEELISVSEKEISHRIKKIRTCLQEFASALINDIHTSFSDEERIVCLNMLRLGLRYGIEIPDLNIVNIRKIDQEFRLPIVDILINQAVSKDNPIPVNILKDALDFADIKNKALLMNRLIVANSRYQKVDDNNKYIEKITNELLSILPEIKMIDNQSKIAVATIYRGVPMSPFFKKEETLNFLKRAEDIILSIDPLSEMDKAVKDENLYTLYLTMSKYYLYTEKNVTQFIEYQKSMIQLDPYDSTAYGELGLFYMKNNYTELAQDNFKKAISLGPPSLAMNCYFLGEVLESMGQSEKAIIAYKECVAYDDEAISPLLKIFTLMKEVDQKYAKEIKIHILENENLLEQLTEEELCILESYSA